MRSFGRQLAAFSVVAATTCFAQAPSAFTADPKDGGGRTKTAEDVQELREKVIRQGQEIEALKAAVDRLAKAAPGAAEKAIVPKTAATTVTGSNQKPSELKAGDPRPADAPVTAGWNGEHFFVKSPDGQFQVQPVGYLNTNYTFYKGDGAPPDTFAIKRARFGVQGNYGKQVDYAFLFDAAATNGVSIRDAYLDFKPFSVLKFQAGQFKEPFSQEVGTGDTNVELLERSIVTVLYPSAAGTFRAPGIAVHGDLAGGVAQYWVGAFNGKGIIANDTTNEPEFVGRLRFYPWKQKKESLFRGVAFGGSIRPWTFPRVVERIELQRADQRRVLQLLSAVAH